MRDRSLDAFRGLAIGGMVLVNNPGSWSHVYAPLLHAEWHGWTPTDLVFPFFVLALGMAMAFSLARYADGGDRAERSVHVRIARRSLLLFAIGMFLNGFPFGLLWDRPFALETWRIPGVLQRLALCYAGGALVVLHLGATARWALALGGLLGYWALLRFVPAPGGAAFDLGPEGSLCGWVDRAVLGSAHLYRDAYDPEGILSTLPAIAQTIVGFEIGRLLRRGEPSPTSTSALFVAGGALVALGELWDSWFPINKPLWTSSFVALTTGWALVAIASIRVLGGRPAWGSLTAPLVVLGRNPLLLFVGSGLVGRALAHQTVPTSDGARSIRAWCFESLVSTGLPEKAASLAFALALVAAWWGILAVLHARRIYWKL